MSDENNTNESLTADRLIAIMHSVTQSSGVRVRPVEAAGQRVWIKQYDIQPLPLARRLHGVLSPVLLPVFLRAPKPSFGEAGVVREGTKIAAFRSAGFRTPAILHRSGPMMVLSDLGPSLWDMAIGMDVASRHRLFCRVFETLGLVHQAGLVHGRPHLRDMAIEEDEICFFDFEEEPEAVMPLADAQARDILLMMMPVVPLASDLDAQRDCLQAWMSRAPAAAIRSLIRQLRFCEPLLWISLRVPASLRGADMKRFIAASRFLVASISDMDSVIAERERGAGSNG